MQHVITPFITIALLCAAASQAPAAPPTIVATNTGASGPGGQTITGGDVVMTFGANGKPLSFTRGTGPNLIRTVDPGPGFVLTYGTGDAATTLPLTTLESKDNRLIASAGPDKPRVTFAVTTGQTHIGFRIVNVENVAPGDRPVLSFQANFDNVGPEVVPFDYMTVSRGEWARKRSFMSVSWPYLWSRGADDPLGGFAFFIPRDDDDHNESLLHIWTEENLPHPKIAGEWTLDRARQWVKDWQETFARQDQLTICAKKPEDLDTLIDYAKKLDVNRLYLHTDTWRGAYWVYDRDPLHVNTDVFPRGEADLKVFLDKLGANGMDAMLHTICYGFGPAGSKYVGKKTDKRLANWGRGTLEKPIVAMDTTILFRPDPGVSFPSPDSYGHWWKFNDVLVGDEIVRGTFTDTDQPVWQLTGCQRGPHATTHEAGTEAIGLLKAYDQNYYPSSMSTLCGETAREYADFFNRLGIRHHEYDGGECHNDVPWGFSKWSMLVYQYTDHPMTSNSSSGLPNAWDLVYRFKSGGRSLLERRGGGIAALTLDRGSRLATSPIENHFTLARGAAADGLSFAIGKPEPMFGISPEMIQGHGLAGLLAEQFMTWRKVVGGLSPEQRKLIASSYYRDPTPNALDATHLVGKTVYAARKPADSFEARPFSIMARGKEDVDWKTVQEFGPILPRQYVRPGEPLRLENPFQRQPPEFVIRVMKGVSDAMAAPAASQSAESREKDKDLDGYLVGAGVKSSQPAPAPPSTSPPASAEQKADASALYGLQPTAGQMTNLGRHQFKDVGPALEVSFDNSRQEEFFQPSGLPSYRIKKNAHGAPGLALTVTGDGSGAYLLVQVGDNKDYVVPIDFTGKRDIVIPTGEVARTTGTWGMRYRTKGAGYGVFHSVSIGFGRVMANTSPQVLIENLRMLPETPSSIQDPVIQAGAGSLAITGTIQSDHYLWYQGGDSVGVYDLNWNLMATLPAVQKDYAVDTGFSEFRIDGRCGTPPPWLDVQFITRGEAIPVGKCPALGGSSTAEQWDVFETSFRSDKRYAKPFVDVEVDVIFRHGEEQWKVPAFWAGGDTWTVRFAPPLQGDYTFQVTCSDPANAGLNGAAQPLRVTASAGDNPLLRHGFLRIAADKRHFEHADGTPFFWLGDTWWKALCKRMTWEGFQELAADRRAKGFNVVQLVCGPYPDENMMEARWENEGGKPYETIDFSVVNPASFAFADRRIKHLVDSGIVPVIFGGWGRPQAGGTSTLAQVGLDGFKRHWRNVIARYGAYPTIWAVGGEAKDEYGPWAELARYVKETDPCRHPLTYHAPAHPRQAIKDNDVFDFDMVGIGHDGYKTAAQSLDLLKSCLSQQPLRPALCGEACYEGHMQTNFQDLQRHLFWSFMLSGAAGHTYGAAGIWHASVDGDPGIDPVYDWTTWKEGMNLPGSAQLGLGKELLEHYRWASFETHAEWTEKDCYAAGIPGQVRFIYRPKRGIYDWNGMVVQGLEPDVQYSGFYFDPATGRRFPVGPVNAPAGEYRSPRLPSPQDWLLVLEANDTK